MSGPSDLASGVKAFSIAGRMTRVRQRCLGMTDADRQWRAQFLKDQLCSHNEPRNVPELYKATTNIFRRLWRTPMYNFQKALESLVGVEPAYYIRHFVGKTSSIIAAIYIGTYFIKYHTNDWTKYFQWSYFAATPRNFPDEPDYPNYREKSPQEYLDDGFYSSPYAKRIAKLPPNAPKLQMYKRSQKTEKAEEVICDK